MTIRSVQEFQQAAIDRQIREWVIGRCGLCGYATAYVIEGEGVLFDAGCYCTSGASLSPRSWAEIADHYNRNQPENNDRISQAWLDEVNAFWGFPLEAKV